MYLMTKNKIGKDCAYTEELSQDLYAIHKINIQDLFAQIYGDTFYIEKKFEKIGSLIFGRPMITFTLKTNDERDEPFSWSHFEK